MHELSDIGVAHDGRVAPRSDRLAFRPGDFTVLLGHNGSGKSTLFGLLARERAPDGGEVRLDGAPLARWRPRALARRVAHLPQRLPEAPGLTVRELAALGRFPWRGAWRRWRAEDDRAVDGALARTGMAGMVGRFVDEVSGGERQRAWIAMLLAQEAPCLLLDEPISALDPARQLEVLNLLARLNDEGREVAAILHDVNLAARFASRIVALKAGRVAFDGPPAALLEAGRLSDLYDAPMELVARPGRPPLATPGDVPR